MSDEYAGLTVRLAHSDKTFATIRHVSLLESGLSAGIPLPYGCANGSCGDCKARIVSGQVSKIRFHDHPITESEKLSGICLLCSYAAQTDLVVEVPEVFSVDNIPFQQTRGKLCHLEQHHDMWIARFKLTRGSALRYVPGQYARVTFPDQQPCNLAIANCPCESSFIEFHIPITSHLPLDGLRRRDRVLIDGPLGHFTMSEFRKSAGDTGSGIQKPVLFIALGAGFSAIKPMVEHVLSLEGTPCTLVWIASPTVRHYQHNLCRSWADAFDQFVYIPLSGEKAFAQSISDNQLPDLISSEIYFSGDHNPTMNSRDTVINAGANPEFITLDTINSKG